jgi:adenylate cyclase
VSHPEDILTAEDYAVLVDSGKHLSAEINTEDLLREILLKAGQLTASADGSILLYDRERTGLYFAAATGESAPVLLRSWGRGSNQRVPLQGSKAGAVFTTGKSLVVDALESDPEHYKTVDQQTQRTTNSMVCVALNFANDRIGVIQILNKRTGNYTERDRVLLENFASQASIAIRNARLFEDLLAHMGLYGSQAALDLVGELDQPAHSEKLTLLFADMRGFTQLCQILNSPERIQKLLDEFLSMLAEQVTQQGGIVNKFLGDGLLALFRQENAAKRAVKCAFGMIQRFDSLHSKWDSASNQELRFLDVGVGIVTDNVILGTIGSARVRDFTAIGTAVNLAAAFENEARGGKRILVDQATYYSVRDIVADAAGPISFQLRKPDQTIGVHYKQYHLVRLKPDVPTRVFIIHNRRDRDFVEKELTESLARYGIETWYSQSDILPGENYVAAIQAGLLKCDWVVVVVSKNSAISDWVSVETRTALSDPRLKTKIIPVILDDTEVGSVSDQLRFLQWIDSRGGHSVAEVLHRRFTTEPINPGASSENTASH